MRAIRTAAIAAAAFLTATGTATAAGEGLTGFRAVEVKVAVPLTPGTPCRLDANELQSRIAERLSAAGIAMGTSALTLRARVSTLSNAITKRCVSAVELDAFTAQTTLIQATRNSIIAQIPLWSTIGIAASDEPGHQSSANASVAAQTDKFIAAFKANN